MKKKILAVLLSAAMLLALAGCGSRVRADDLLKKVEPVPSAAPADPAAGSAAAAAFGVELFRQAFSGENTLVSPLSVFTALSMTANGAKGETLAQMEQVLGMETGELNAFLKAYLSALPEGKTHQLSLANSIWFTDEEHFTVEERFLQTVAAYYDAAVCQTPFDETALRDINTWVSENTDGMIPEILDRVPEHAVMYLVNALAFDAEWTHIYREDQVHSRTFTTEDGRQQEVEMMYSTENRYLEDDQATGFLKYYSDRSYAFAALLPREGVSVEEYAASLSGEHLLALLAEAEQTAVEAGIPKFEMEYDAELSQLLMAMGITDAFDWTAADFTALGSSTEGNIVIDRVLHKTFIAVDEKGTRAGAATAVEMVTEGDMKMENVVILDRPFVYLLIDCENNVPLMIGALMEVDGN